MGPQEMGIMGGGTTMVSSDMNSSTAVTMVSPQNQESPHLVPSTGMPPFSPLSFANLVLPFEPPSPTVNLTAQRSTDPSGSDLPTDASTLRFFYNIGCDYFRMCSTSAQPLVFSSMQGYNGNFSFTVVPYIPDPNSMGPDIRCSIPETSGAASSHNGLANGAPPTSAFGAAGMQLQQGTSYSSTSTIVTSSLPQN